MISIGKYIEAEHQQLRNLSNGRFSRLGNTIGCGWSDARTDVLDASDLNAPFFSMTMTT